MEPKVGVDLVFRFGGDERIKRSPYRLRARRVHPRRRQCGCLTFDSEPEVDHVDHVVMCPDGRGLDGERRRLGHREHERATPVERFDQPFGAQPRDSLADHRPGHAVLVDEFGFGGQLVAGRQVAGEDLVLQAGDHPLRQCRRHR